MLDNQTITEIQTILFSCLDKRMFKAFIFGSWAQNKARKFSDIDVGIEGSGALDFETLARLREAFEQSDLPYSVDVVDFSAASKKFKTVSKRHAIALN